MEGPLPVTAADGAALTRDHGEVRRDADGLDGLDPRQLDDREVRNPLGDLPNIDLSLSNLQASLQHSGNMQNCNLEQRDSTHVDAPDGESEERHGGGDFAAHAAGVAQAAAEQCAVPIAVQPDMHMPPLNVECVHEMQPIEAAKGKIYAVAAGDALGLREAFEAVYQRDGCKGFEWTSIGCPLRTAHPPAHAPAHHPRTPWQWPVMRHPCIVRVRNHRSSPPLPRGSISIASAPQ